MHLYVSLTSTILLRTAPHFPTSKLPKNVRNAKGSKCSHHIQVLHLSQYDLVNENTDQSLRVINKFLYSLEHLLNQFSTLVKAVGWVHTPVIQLSKWTHLDSCMWTQYVPMYLREPFGEETVTVDLNQLSIGISDRCIIRDRVGVYTHTLEIV